VGEVLCNKMSDILLVKGIVLGFSIAAPVGAIGLLCINRTLKQGWLTGFICGLGAATADSFYGCVAAFGLSYVVNFFVAQQLWLRLVGGIFLGYLGVKFIINQPRVVQTDEVVITNNNLIGAYLSTFLLTLTNPLTILSFSAIFASFGAVRSDNSLLLVFGVFLGSAFWWLLLSSAVAWFRTQITPSKLRWLNYISGAIMIAFGLVALLKNP